MRQCYPRAVDATGHMTLVSGVVRTSSHDPVLSMTDV